MGLSPKGLSKHTRYANIPTSPGQMQRNAVRIRSASATPWHLIFAEHFTRQWTGCDVYNGGPAAGIDFRTCASRDQVFHSQVRDPMKLGRLFVAVALASPSAPSPSARTKKAADKGAEKKYTEGSCCDKAQKAGKSALTSAAPTRQGRQGLHEVQQGEEVILPPPTVPFRGAAFRE